MTIRNVSKKLKLAKANRKIKRLPPFIILRTKKRVSYNRRTRFWRTDKLRVEG